LTSKFIESDAPARKPEQLDLFGITPPSTSIVGLIVTMAERPCRHCGSNAFILGSSCGPHHGRLGCAGCDRHSGWISGETRRFIDSIIDHFGRPDEPIIVRHGG
jgi:hypothetical protein